MDKKQEIAKQEILLPVSIDNSNNNRNKLTECQKAIISLLNLGIKENRPITREDIYKCWRDSGRGGTRKYFTGTFPCSGTTYYDEKNWAEYPAELNGYSPYMNWFKSNLGSCIIKGKLLAIPLIEID